MKIQVGKLYFSPLAGTVKCIAERDNTFIVENDDYRYHVNAQGEAIYVDDNEAGGLNLTGEVRYLESEDGKEFMKNFKPKETKHEHYFKDVSQMDKIDVYAVLHLFEVTDPCIQHAVKKLLCTGKRGHKDFQKDIQDSIDSLVRCQELHNELHPELTQGNQDA